MINSRLDRFVWDIYEIMYSNKHKWKRVWICANLMHRVQKQLYFQIESERCVMYC